MRFKLDPSQQYHLEAMDAAEKDVRAGRTLPVPVYLKASLDAIRKARGIEEEEQTDGDR